MMQLMSVCLARELSEGSTTAEHGTTWIRACIDSSLSNAPKSDLPKSAYLQGCGRVCARSPLPRQAELPQPSVPGLATPEWHITLSQQVQ